MKQKFKHQVVLLFLFLFALPLAGAQNGHAAEGPFSLHIQKYALDESGQQHFGLQDGTQLPETGFDGYQKMAGVDYRIQSVVPKETPVNDHAYDEANYTVTNQIDLTVTTDERGSAVVSSDEYADFGAGYYLITEIASDLVPTPMTPLVVQLPMTSGVDGHVLNDLYIYPKSGGRVPGTPTVPPIPDTHTPPPYGVPPIPNTSGELTGFNELLGLVGILTLAFAVILVLIKKEMKTAK